MDLERQMKYSYIVAVVGVGLMAINGVYGVVRGIMVRQMFRTGFNGGRQFANMNLIGPTNTLTILPVAIAIIGLVWLGMVLIRSPK